MKNEWAATAIDASVPPSRVLTARTANVVPGVTTGCAPSSSRKRCGRGWTGDGEAVAEPLLPVDGAGARVEAGGDAVVGHDVELVAGEKRRRRERRAARQLPRHVRPGHVPLAVWADRQERRLLEAGGDEHQPGAVDRPRHVAEALGVGDAPDLLSGLRVVGKGIERADADDLVTIRRGWRAASSTPASTAAGDRSSTASCRSAYRAPPRSFRRSRRN